MCLHLDWVQEWLRINGIRGMDVTCVDRYSETTKAEWCKRYGYSLAIDDAPHHAMQLAETVDTVYMVDKPYNRHIAKVPHPASSIIRVKSLREAAERIIDGERSGARANKEVGNASGRAGDADSFIPGVTHQAVTGVRGAGVLAG